jgi:hypothetical protein
MQPKSHITLFTRTRCIIQDDVDDWAKESATMKDVYGNTAFSIAATAARDGSDGLFSYRNLKRSLPIKVQVDFLHEPDYIPSGTYWVGPEGPRHHSIIDPAPLNQRTWVIQERFLSPRIIHFTDKLLFWECRESFNSEIWPEGHASISPIYVAATGDLWGLKWWLNDIKRYGVTQCGDEQSTRNFYHLWQGFRIAYTTCFLTNGNDVLVALSGIAQEIATYTQDEMIAGLWKRYLIEELCWLTRKGLKHLANPLFEHSVNFPRAEPRRPPFTSGPSWSWVSSTDIVEYNNRGFVKDATYRELAVVIDASAQSAPSGALNNAKIVLRCRLIPITLNGTIDSSSERLSYHATTMPPDCGLSTLIDETAFQDRNSPSSVEAFLLLLRYGLIQGKAASEGIIVTSCSEEPGTYRRIGKCYLDQDKDPSAILDSYESVAETVVCLV